MRGWLVVNGFVDSPKFAELHAWLIESASRQGIELILQTNLGLAANLSEALALNPPQFILFWDKDIRLCELLEAQGIPTFNSSKAIELCDDKTRTALAIARTQLRQPVTVVVPHRFRSVDFEGTPFIDDAIATLGFPLVAKEGFGSFGAQVFLIHTRAELLSFLNNLDTRPGLLQEFIASSEGRDLRIQVVGGRAVAAMERHANPGEFRANLTNGGSAVSVHPTPEQEAFAVAAATALGLDFGGIDLLFGPHGEPIFCEANSNAHFVNLSRITGIDVGDAIMAYVKNAVA